MRLAPLASCPKATLAGLKVVLTDIDGTLTLHSRLSPEAFKALADLRAAGLKVIAITGRPGGWCDHIARQWPVDGIIGENGAFSFRYDEALRTMVRVYAQTMEERKVNAKKLWAIAEQVLREFPGTAIASDQAYREIDVAIDFCEDVPPLPFETAQAIADRFAAEGAVAKVSSIHVNAWFGSHNKLTMARKFLAEAFEIDSLSGAESIAYVGDSPNDAPMFEGFENGIGVANVMAYVKIMPHLPRYVTKAEGGLGFAEFASAVLAAKGA